MVCWWCVCQWFHWYRYVLKLPDDDQWGSLQENGWWTGMVGEVHRKVSVREADGSGAAVEYCRIS